MKNSSHKFFTNWIEGAMCFSRRLSREGSGPPLRRVVCGDLDAKCFSSFLADEEALQTARPQTGATGGQETRRVQRTFKCFIASLFLFCCVIVPPAHAGSNVPRNVVMLSAGVVNLTLLGTIIWKATHKASSHATPNYQMSPNSPEAILLEKLSDSSPTIPFHHGIKTFSGAALRQYLQETGEEPTAIATYLHQQEEKHSRFEIKGVGGYHYLLSPNRPVPGVTGSINPFLTEQEGMFSEDGHNGFVGADLRGAIVPSLTFEAEPLALASSHSAGTQKNTQFYLKRGSLLWSPKQLEIEIGKESVQWGFGRQGTMTFSGNAESFYLFRVGNSTPVTLPGFLHYLGPTRTDFFITFLDANREFPYSILHGMKTTFLPHPRWEIGFGQSMQFGGEGSGSWSPLNYFADDWTGSGNNKVNRNFVVDTRWRIPKLEIEPYAELYWEDCCDAVVINPRDTLNLFGLYFPNIGVDGKADFAAEWVRTNGITYRHSGYSSGFFYKGHGIGHPIGPDGTGIYGIFRYFYTPTLFGKVVTAFEQRGRLQEASPEDRYRINLSLYQEIHSHVRLTWDAGYERVTRFNFQANTGRDNFMAGLQLELL